VKYVVCVPDGCADRPVAALGGRTPLEAAVTPTLDALAARGEVGRAAVIPPGMPPGSDVGNLSILGYDPARWHTGRAPIEAAALGVSLRPDQVAFRCNLVTLDDDGTMVDFAGGHPSSEVAAEVVAALQDELGDDEISFHPGVEYRHILVAPASWADAECVPPHDLSDREAVWPTGAAASKLRRVMEASRPIVGASPLAATQVWLWGQGPQAQLPPFSERHGVRAAMSSPVDLVRGLGVLAGIEPVDVPGMTAGFDTDYAAQRDDCLARLRAGADLYVLHVEATDEAGHAGDVNEKVNALQRWDRDILAGLVAGLDELGPWRLLLLPDHPTPVELKTHTDDPVPYLLVDSSVDGPGGTYSEAGVADRPAVVGHELVDRLLAR
jgi:2,3-bisphosphoglycerate-independent phosphoglycerate mutase